MKNKNAALSLIMALFLFVFSALAWFKPEDEFSVSERRRLASFPRISAESLLSGRFMTDFEKYSQDQFPMRDSFRALKAGTAMSLLGNLDNNGIYLKDGSAVKMEYPLNEASVLRAGERLSYIYDKYLSGTEVKAYAAVIPDKNRYAASDGEHLSLDYSRLSSLFAESVDWAQYIELGDCLSLEDYYKTDSHWRQEKILPVARTVAGAMGAEIDTELSSHTLERDYRGVYSGQWALPMESEKIIYLRGPAIDSASVYDWQNGREAQVYDMERGMGRDAYELFLSGPISLISMENPLSRSGKELVIFRDSFGSSLAPLLLSGYDRITLVDIRYMHPDMAGRYIDFTDQDVLFIYSASVLNNSETIK